MNRKVLDRIKEDFEHGGQLGPKSTRRLIGLLDLLVSDIEALKQEAVRETPYSVDGY